jgi:uncharacterized protein YwqG
LVKTEPMLFLGQINCADLQGLPDADVIGEPHDFRLLLQLDQYSNGDESEGWASGGSLYFAIREHDLRERRFDRCEFEMQVT